MAAVSGGLQKQGTWPHPREHHLKMRHRVRPCVAVIFCRGVAGCPRLNGER